MKKIYIGTSGYSYPHWRGIFYPQDLSESKWLEYYSKFFSTVELNVTFYRLPQESAFLSWYKRTHEDFLFAVKGSRFITHVKKLKDVKESLKLFFSRAKILKEKLGVVLWQFPESFQYQVSSVKKLEDFLKTLSHVTKSMSLRHAFEFRHESWFYEEIYDLLRKYNSALVIADSNRWPQTEEITADFIYIRFHGGKSLYSSEYSKKELESWAKKIKKWVLKRNVFIYFNNDAYGFAVKNAEQLKRILEL